MKNLQSERRYDIDWIRIMLIFSVFLFHIGMFFNSFGWHIKNEERVLWLDPVMAYLHRWRMPLLFFVSGVGTWFALGKRNIGQYMGERAKKLLIPLVFGMFVIVPPQVYMEKQAQYGTFFNFIPHITEGSYPVGNFSWHHLWFVLYLFICSAAALPLIFVFRSGLKQKITNFLDAFLGIKGSILMLSVPLFIVHVWLINYFPWETHALVNDWAYLSYSFLFFIYGFVLFSDKRLIEHIINQRRINGIAALLLTIVFFIDYFHSLDPIVPETLQYFLGSILEWSIGISIIGYAGKYMNRENKLRKYLNEAIYPFYILHQTAIIVIGFYLINANFHVGIKALVLTFSSFFVCVAVYWFLIRPFQITRVLFGMPLKNKKLKLQVSKEKPEIRIAS
ncbi:MAG: acyltransferase [Bacteroidales bacterium]|nr:acyltransferase [Bacteroidales bacterium]